MPPVPPRAPSGHPAEARLEPEAARRWIAQVFSAQAAARGEVVRRATDDVDRLVGRAALLAEAHRRGFAVVENGGQIVIFCNREPVVLLTAPAPLHPETTPAARAQIPWIKGFAKAFLKAFGRA